jgi:hypothetical protein
MSGVKSGYRGTGKEDGPWPSIRYAGFNLNLMTRVYDADISMSDGLLARRGVEIL